MDLLSSQPFWPIQNGLIASYPSLEEDLTCDVVIVGAGVSGALAAWHLVEAGLQVVVLDRRDVACGSTAGSTSLLQYEIDEPLHKLIECYGRPKAEHAYQRCLYAIAAIQKLVHSLKLSCDFKRTPSLLLASQKGHLKPLRKEFEARRQAGLDVCWWNRATLKKSSRLPHPGAIYSHDAAHVDIHRLTHGLLAASAQAGVKIFDRTEVTETRITPRGVLLQTRSGHRVRARHRVLATGYEADVALPQRVTEWYSTYALISEPVTELRDWPASGCLLWDTSDPYLYLRPTVDQRIIIGGYDEPFRTAAARDKRLPQKVAALRRRFAEWFPRIRLDVAYAWAGTFAGTNDGLPFIGAHPDLPRTWLALGYGGNGITFSLLAAELIRDHILGRKNPDAEVFGFDRLVPRKRGGSRLPVESR